MKKTNPMCRIAVRLTRSYGRTRWGVFTNLWPTALSRGDRDTIGTWYANVHIPSYVLEIYPKENV